ncbi:ankyrin repeat-containing protein, putative [Ricinus communis]|uniref:Ankyrin repeat-containing protein, putative n=1 Tax=Ricinus communis TaxID=3988 RepID=B9S5U1_RICCO|nr:ankyrin repeat-containing protein, putative [Ricinus communis]
MEREDLRMLYEAAKRGCVETLNALTRRDQFILNKVSLTSFTETPLHLSSLLGHLHFSINVLKKCPAMAIKLDSLQRSPLHLASAEGHTDIVKVLLAVNTDVCLVRDEDGRIPLHLAAMRGNAETIQELVSASPESTSELLDGETILQLSVKYNHLKALKLLVEMVSDDDLVNKENQDGNTILHLAAMLKQLKTIRYLLSLPKLKERANSLNRMGMTALDVLDQSSRDFRSCEIRKVLIEAGAKRRVQLNNNLPTSSVAVSTEPPNAAVFTKTSSKAKNHEEARGALMIVATVIATMTFQAALNPPGGIWQQDFITVSGGPACSDTNICEAGTSVLAYAYPDAYIYFLMCNALVIGGFPLRNKLCVWLLAQAIGVTLIFLALSYIQGIFLVTPQRLRVKVAKMDIKMARERRCAGFGVRLGTKTEYYESSKPQPQENKS